MRLVCYYVPIDSLLLIEGRRSSAKINKFFKAQPQKHHFLSFTTFQPSNLLKSQTLPSGERLHLHGLVLLDQK